MKPGVYRDLTSLGHEVLVTPVGEPYEFQRGEPDTTLVKCLVLHSEDHFAARPGEVKAFAVVCLKPFAT